MRKIYTRLLWLLVFAVGLFVGNKAVAQTNGIYESYAILSINGGADAYYDMGAATGNPDFQGANLGNFNASQSLVVKGGQNKTFKCSGGDIFNGHHYYRVWLTSAGASGTFTSQTMGFVSNDAGGCGGNQTWEVASGATNIISGLTTPGNYTLEVYSDADGVPGTTVANNGGANYRATFNFCGPTTGALPAGNYAIPGCFPTVAAAVTYINANGVTGTGVVQFDVAAGGSETTPAGGISITATGTATLGIRFVKAAGAAYTITAPTPQTSGNLNDAIIKIVGGDYITIDGFTLLENAANTTTTAASNNMTEWGVALLYASTTNGAQNCTIQNNTITLNRTYQNTFGIYSNSTHSATAVTTSATATTAAGGNSGLKIYGNTISNVNNGILVLGPTPAADYNTGIDIGGTGGVQANTITNYGTTGTFSGYANVSGTVYGILIRNSIGYNISYNSITSSVGGVTAGTLRGIYNVSASNTPTGTFTNTINNNTIALTYGVATGTLQGITVEGTNATITSTQNINNNNFTTLTGSIATSATITAISSVAPHLNLNINGNTFTNITSNTTGSFTFFGHSYTMPATGVQTISGNSIVTAFNKTGAGGTVTISTSGASSPNGTSYVFTNNNFSGITVTGATTINGISNTDGSGTSPNRTVTGNTFSNWTGGTSSITGMNFSYIGATSSISNNTLSNITGQGAISGITINNTFAGGNPLNVANNTITGFSSTGTGGAVTGLTISNTSPLVNVNNNSLSTLSSTGAAAVSGIVISGATATNVFKNKICDISGSNASSTVNGILVSSGTTVSVYNNRVGDLRTPAANAANPLVGINITGGTTVNAYYNTVNLAATSSGALFGSSALSASSSVTLALNNNIFTNASGTAGAGLAVAYRRSSTTLTSYANTSDRNDFVATTVFTDGTNTDAALSAYKTRVAPRDANAISVAAPFLSTTCGNANFLKIDPAVATQIESGGANITGITDDFEGDTRQGNAGYTGTGTAPDLGADEVEGTPAPVCTGTPASSTINGAAAVCSGLGTTLSLSAIYTDLGITHHWGSSTVSGGPYTGLGTGATQATGPLTVTTYFVDTIFCTNSGLYFVTPEKAVTINALPTVTVSPATGVLCQPGATPITLTASGASTYAWSPATGLSATTGAAVDANPGVSTTYTVTGTDGNGCVNTATAAITVSQAPSPVTITPVAPSICAGGVELLTAAGGTSNDVIGTGTGFVGATSQPTAFCNRFDEYIGQQIYTAAELTAAGYVAGNLTSIAFNVSSLGDAATNANYEIQIGHVGSTSTFATTSFLSTAGFTSVYGPVTHTHTASGWQTITFTTPFNWNGVDNICVHMTHDGIDNINNAQTQFTTTAGNTTLTFISSTPGATSTTGTLSNSRLNVRFTPVASNPITWSPVTGLFTDLAATIPYTGTATNTVYASPAATQTYTATATNGVGCTSTANVTVTLSAGAAITAQPAALAICAGSNAFFKVTATGPSLTYQWFKDGNPLSNGGTIGGVTTDSLFINGVVAGDAGVYTVQVSSSCGSPVTSDGAAVLTVNAKPTVPVTPAGPVVICAPATQILDASGTNAAATVGYQWINNGAAIAGQTSATYTVTASGNYRVRVQDGVTGCFDTSAVVAVTINPQPTPVTISPAAPTVCAGTIQQLTANGGTLPTTQQLGAGTSLSTASTTTSALGPNPLQSYYGGAKQQMIVTAAELSGLGMSNGSVISSIAFNLGAAETARTLQNYVVKVSNTALSAFASTTFEAAGTVVRNPADYTPVAGWNTIVFDNTFTWNGTSNLLIEVNFSNNDGGGSGTSRAEYSTTSAATTLFYRADNNTAAAVDAATTASFAAYTQRNNIRFTYGSPTSIVWAPTTGLFTDAGATTPYTGTSATTVYFSGSATQAYTATATSGAGCPSVPGNVTVTVNPAATANAGGNQSICGGNTFTPSGATATNNSGVNWTTSGDGTFANGTTLTPTYTPGVADVLAGTVTLTLTATGNAPCANATSNMTLTITTTGLLAGTPGGPQVCETKTVGIGATYNDGSCNTIASVIPAGGSPVTGSITSCVKVENSIPTYNAKYYVARHYDIEPAVAPSTSSANVVLYFTPAEMAAFNADASAIATHFPLPVLPTDNTDSVRIEQYHGTGSDPTNYTGSLETWSTGNGLTVVFSNGYWVITVPATSFSGFWLTAKIRNPLPIKVEYFRGAKQGSSHVLDWKVVPVNTLNGTITLERSSDGRSFASIYSITASSVRMQQPFSYSTSNLLKGTNYYRLKMTDDNGVVTYSSIVALLNSSKGFELVNITPNPVTEGRFKLNITAAEQLKMEVVVTDMAGRIVSRQTNNIISGFNAIDVNVSTLANGAYQVMGIIDGERTKAMKFVKQ